MASIRSPGFSLGCFGLSVLLLMAWLGYWLMIMADDPEERGDYPSWYLDPLDLSWQQSLTANADGSLGSRASHPIRVCGAVGEQTYLASITCTADGAAAPFDSPFAAAEAKREPVASPLGMRFVDRIEVPCPSGNFDLYLSPYHCGNKRTSQVPAGFSPRF